MRWEPWRFNFSKIDEPFWHKAADVFNLFFGNINAIFDEDEPDERQRMGFIDYLFPFPRLLLNIAYKINNTESDYERVLVALMLISGFLGIVLLSVNLILSAVFTLLALPIVGIVHHYDMKEVDRIMQSALSKMEITEVSHTVITRYVNGDIAAITRNDDGIIPPTSNFKSFRIVSLDTMTLISGEQVTSKVNALIVADQVTGEEAAIEINLRNEKGLKEIMKEDWIGVKIMRPVVDEELEREKAHVFDVKDATAFLMGATKAGKEAPIRKDFFESPLFERNLLGEIFRLAGFTETKKNEGDKKKNGNDQSSSENKPTPN